MTPLTNYVCPEFFFWRPFKETEFYTFTSFIVTLQCQDIFCLTSPHIDCLKKVIITDKNAKKRLDMLLFSLAFTSNSHFSASGLSITFDANNPVVAETGENITMHWSINLTNESIDFIRAFVQFQSQENRQIVVWSEDGPEVSRKVEIYYKNRLSTRFASNTFTLVIANANYSDTGSYSVTVRSNSSLKGKTAAVTLKVHGMYFCYF